MDFFEYASIADTVSTEIFGVLSPLWVSLVVGGLCFLIVYVFQSVGLYTVAKRAGYKNVWMAFIPFFNTYYIGVCGQKNKFFNIDTKKIAIATAVLEFVLLCVYIVYFVASVLISPHLEAHTEEIGLITATEWVLPNNFFEVHPELYWAAWCTGNLSKNQIGVFLIILALLRIVYTLGKIIVLNCFFQTYSARRSFIFTITSIFFPVQGILIFAVRNNKGMKYSDYVRMQQERAYRQYREQNFYQNPYNQNPYSNNNPPYESEQPQPQQTQQPPQQEDPFSEFGSTNNSEPFDEFKN